MKINIKQIVLLTFGSVMFAAGIYFFRMPNNFVVGGASGLAIILSKLFESITKGWFVTIINTICIIAGWIFLGKSFSWKTVYCSIVYSAVIVLLEQTVKLDVPFTDETLTELILSVILCCFSSKIPTTCNLSAQEISIPRATTGYVSLGLKSNNLLIAICSFLKPLILL